MTNHRPAKVLIVDDETALLESYAAILETRYAVETAETGAEALSAVDGETDIVVLDRRLPEHSGEEILSAIRERGHDCRIVFCSAVTPDPEIVPMEPDGYLYKPVGVDEIYDAIENQLEWAQQPADVSEYHRLEHLRESIESTGMRAQTRSDPRYKRLLERIEEVEGAVESAGESQKSVA